MKTAKCNLQAQNEQVLHKMADDCGGVFGTLAEAISELGTPRVKVVNSAVTFRGFLSLGDPETYETAMCIDIERFGRIMPAMPPSASRYAVKSAPGVGQEQTEDVDMDAGGMHDAGEGLVSIKSESHYQVPDDTAPGGKRDVERSELAKGYEYGRTVVPVSESDQMVLSMETKASYEIVGFIPESSVSHSLQGLHNKSLTTRSIRIS